MEKQKWGSRKGKREIWEGKGEMWEKEEESPGKMWVKISLDIAAQKLSHVFKSKGIIFCF